MIPAYYLRVSTNRQEFASQRHALGEYAKRHKLPGIARQNFFAEKISGAKGSRRELDRLLQACRLGAFDSIITFRADRIGRSLRHMVNIYAEMKSAGVRVIGVADGVDTDQDTPSANAFRNMLATFAELTRETIVENTRAGLAAAAKRGKRPGRPRKNDAKIVIALKLDRQGKTRSEISRRTGLSIGYVSDLVRGKARTA